MKQIEYDPCRTCNLTNAILYKNNNQCANCKLEKIRQEIEDLKHDNTKLVEALSNYVSEKR